MSVKPVHSPFFTDPVCGGAADPALIWNRVEKTWWMVYTNRRANAPGAGVSWVHGTDFGIASSDDGGHRWIYRGVLPDLAVEPGRNTFWAPEIVFAAGRYHMFVSYITGVPTDWDRPRHILHYTSGDMWQWSCRGALPLSSDRCIDACVFRLPGGGYRLWYKDEAHGSHTFCVDADDQLENWRSPRPAVTDCAHEGPNVFRWKDRYWMVTDPWDGLGVYSSADLQTWSRQENILRVSGTRPDDQGEGYHADVVVQGGEAYIFYFTHPGRAVPAEQKPTEYELRRSSIQMARLALPDGHLVCDRDEIFSFELGPDEAE